MSKIKIDGEINAFEMLSWKPLLFNFTSPSMPMRYEHCFKKNIITQQLWYGIGKSEVIEGDFGVL